MIQRSKFVGGMLTGAVLVTSVLAAPAMAQGENPRYFYTYQKQPRALGVDASRIAVFSDQAAALGAAERGAAEPAWIGAAAARGFDTESLEPMVIRGWSTVGAPAAAGRGEDVVAPLVADLAAQPGVDFVSPVFFDEYGPVVVTRDLLIGFYDDITRAEAERVIADEGLGQIVERDFQGMAGVYRVRSQTKNGVEVLDASNRVSLRAEVRYAEPDLIMTTQKELIPNDPLFSSLWGLHNVGQSGGVVDVDMNGPEAWDITTGDPSVIVVVIDDGVDLTHPDLNLTMGVDFTGIGTAGGHDPNNPCDNHGTLVSGCIASKIGNSLQVVGIAPNCLVSPAKFSISNQPCSGSGTFQISWMTGSINWSTTIGAKVTNNSNGFGPNSSVDTAYTNTRNLGVTHFASTGNGGTGTIGYPSSSPSVNAVGAITRFGVRSSFSQFGTGIDFVAPGSSIVTTTRGGGTGSVQGTSFSSPYAAGVAALLYSRNNLLTPTDVETIMAATTKDLGAAGYDTEYGHGLVNAKAALDMTSPPSPPGAFALASPANSATNVSRLPTFEWSPAQFAQDYRLEVDDDPGFGSPVIDMTTALTIYNFPGPALPVNTQFHWRVTANNSLGMTGSTPATFSFTTISDPPGAFSLSAPLDGATNVVLNPNFSWTAAERADNYRLRVDDDPGFGSPAIDTTTPLTSFTTGAPLLAETTYYWTVDAQNPIGNTTSSPSSRSFTTTGTPPGAFSLLSPADGTNISTFTPTLQWSNSSNAAEYRVIIDDTITLTSPVLDTSGVATNSFLVPGGVLQNDVRYYWRIIAMNPYGSATATPNTASFGVLVAPCDGDANGDRMVDFSDISAVLANWGGTGPEGDANHNGAVNFTDITRVLSRWLMPCP